LSDKRPLKQHAAAKLCSKFSPTPLSSPAYK
jgi:hypothetical protein